MEASTFPSEIVVCRIDGGREISLFCKYCAKPVRDGHGNRGGVEYEAQIYEGILRRCTLTVPRFYGFYKGPDGRCWLVLSNLPGTTRVSRASDPQAMLKAARWLACFHARNEVRASRESTFAGLIRYDRNYFLGWVHRTMKYTKVSGQGLDWLDALCERFETLIPVLLEPPLTVIHGEYYSQNVLFHKGEPYPVDWESAAVACGELDLASLTDNWPDEISRHMEHIYEITRWPGRVPDSFRDRLAAARIHTQMRWLGDRHEITSKDCEWRLEQLKELGERVGHL
jgi:aminoglycoside phosphotransferase (APT) family kinase protein